MIALIKCLKCGADIEERDCSDIDITNDDIILEKWGICTECEAEIWWEEVVPNNPIIIRNVTVEE